ncbi:MAG: leucine-rich repeat protein [Eubacteriales bacterium]
MKIKIISALLSLFLCMGITTALSSCTENEDENNTSASGGTEVETDQPPMELATGDDLSYVFLNDGKYCAVIGLGASNGAIRIEIPEIYEGLPVVGISSEAFASSIHLKSVELPNSLKYIGNNAFEGCSNLESINIPESLEYLGSQAFDGCDKLPLTEYEGALYLGSESAPYTILMSAKSTDIDGICKVHTDTKIINELAFADCTEVDGIIIPNGIRYIGLDAFADCYDLEFTTHESLNYLGNESNPYLVCVDANAKRDTLSYTIHEDTRIIAPGAFSGCEKLEEVNIPNGLKTIGEFAFDDCPRMKTIAFDRISLWTVVDIEDLASTVYIENSDVNTKEMLLNTHKSCAWIRQ